MDEDGLGALELYEEALVPESTRENTSTGETEHGVRDVLNALMTHTQSSQYGCVPLSILLYVRNSYSCIAAKVPYRP
eukprot:SAG11_NODE_566_length_8482_cov_13.445477_6_plen_76_part_01